MHFKFKTISGRKYLYVIKNERIDGKVVQTIQKYIGTADQVYDLDLGTKRNKNSFLFFWQTSCLTQGS